MQIFFNFFPPVCKISIISWNPSPSSSGSINTPLSHSYQLWGYIWRSISAADWFSRKESVNKLVFATHIKAYRNFQIVVIIIDEVHRVCLFLTIATTFYRFSKHKAHLILQFEFNSTICRYKRHKIIMKQAQKCVVRTSK